MKRIFSMFLVLLLSLTFCVGIVSATEGGIDPHASHTIASTGAFASSGDNAGEVDIDFTITATDTASKLGAVTIVIHKPDFTTYTVTGTTNNGLLGSGDAFAGTYTYKGIKGHSYYAEVTLISTVGSLSDTRTITTNSATAP